MNLKRNFQLTLLAAGILSGTATLAADTTGAAEFHKSIQPMLENYCFDCHANGESSGKVSFDKFKNDQAMLEDRELWLRVMKNVRAGLMPPPKKSQPTAAEKERLAQWIKDAAFNIDPQNPDPGRVTIRRLNRAEYRNTIRDLLGVEFDTTSSFPPDDTGNGFDNIGDVLTLPPMLLEKYVVAANQIVSQAVPVVARIEPEKTIQGRDFSGGGSEPAFNRNGGRQQPRGLSLSYYQPAAVSNVFNAPFAGKYQLAVSLMVNEKFVDNVFDYNKCRFIFRVDGKELMTNVYSWEGGKPYHYDFDVNWAAGDHMLAFELQPLTTNEQVRTLSMQISSIKVTGPDAQEHWTQPKDYPKYFPKEAPVKAADRRAYARELLGKFAARAFRRPPENSTLDRLVVLAESVYSQPGKSFEAGVAQGMVAILSSPRFLFLEERPEKSLGSGYALVDEYSLASRLSYFLWSSMPDAELIRLAAAGELRKNLKAQVDRMMKDEHSQMFVSDFTGQWLKGRDIEVIPIEARTVLQRETKVDPEIARNRTRFRELNDKADEELTADERAELVRIRGTFRRGNRQQPRADLTGEIRQAMRQETEKTFDYILREDRSLLELIDSDYTFLNERLARHYGITNVVGNEMRLVKLDADSPRGGVLTQGTVLASTSNPTRTSPVKRGVFILDNILGTPVPPPPPDIPQLEDAVKGITNHVPSLRETLAIHRENALCNSCHNRMDPLGLALENFNAMGMWRDREFDEPIDASGKLITGEEFKNIKELKQALVKTHDKDFYRTITEKMLIYALGRGLEYYDVETTDRIVNQLVANGGKPSALLSGVIDSVPFQKTRLSEPVLPKKSDQLASATTKP